jgi:CCR4-NOT transcription complex subunit 9
MMPAPHVYGHHQFNPQGDAWMHQQPSHHHQQAAVAAAASAAQQQHYNRLASAHSNVATLTAAHAQEGGHENMSEDNRRTMAFIADLLNESTRETALLELSKKREQVPELALILWHSFGMNKARYYSETLGLPPTRRNDLIAPGDHLRLYSPQPFTAYGCRL